MKRFLLFSGQTYYAQGGAWDFDNSFDTLDEARAEGKRMEGEYTVDWWHIFDAEEGIIEEKSETQAHS